MVCRMIKEPTSKPSWYECLTCKPSWASECPIFGLLEKVRYLESTKQDKVTYRALATTVKVNESG